MFKTHKDKNIEMLEQHIKYLNSQLKEQSDFIFKLIEQFEKAVG